MNVKKVYFDNRVKPKNVLALNDKVAAIRRYEANPVYKSVGRYFNCSPDQIKRIIQQKHEILEEWNNRTKKSVIPTSHELKSVRMSFLGKAVHEWIRRMMYYTDFNITNALIQTMAIEFKKVLGLQNFFPDKNWIANFRSTYGLTDVNTKTMDIGYQESHSVQIRDILRHLKQVCGTSSTKSTSEASGTDDDATITFGDFRVNTEDNEAVEIKEEIETCTPSCSSSSTPIVVPILLTKPDILPVTVVKSEPLEPEPEHGPINTNDEAISCVKLLEDFALLKENFRLIGLIERLEQAIKQDKQ